MEVNNSNNEMEVFWSLTSGQLPTYSMIGNQLTYFGLNTTYNNLKIECEQYIIKLCSSIMIKLSVYFTSISLCIHKISVLSTQ